MKKLVLALALISSAPAFAIGYDNDHGVGVPETKYFSWCVRNTVMELDASNQQSVKMDCTRAGLQCAQEERIIGGGIRVVSASCKRPKSY